MSGGVGSGAGAQARAATCLPPPLSPCGTGKNRVCCVAPLSDVVLCDLSSIHAEWTRPSLLVHGFGWARLDPFSMYTAWVTQCHIAMHCACSRATVPRSPAFLLPLAPWLLGRGAGMWQPQSLLPRGVQGQGMASGRGTELHSLDWTGPAGCVFHKAQVCLSLIENAPRWFDPT